MVFLLVGSSLLYVIIALSVVVSIMNLDRW